MKERRLQASTKRIDWVPLLVLVCLLYASVMVTERAAASKSSAPVKKDSQEQKEQAESHHGKWHEGGAGDEHHGKWHESGSGNEHHEKWRNNESEDGHHWRRHSNGDRHHGRKGNWGDNDDGDGRRKKLHSLDDDYTMEQIWKLPGLSDKQRGKLVDIEKKFSTDVRPMRKQLKRIREELEGTNVNFVTDAGGEIGGAVMSGLASVGADKQHDSVKTREPSSLPPSGGSRAASRNKKHTEKAKAEDAKRWYRADQIDDDDGKEPTYKTARISALQTRSRDLKRKMKALKEKAWIDIRTILTDKQKAVLAQQ